MIEYMRKLSSDECFGYIVSVVRRNRSNARRKSKMLGV